MTPTTPEQARGIAAHMMQTSPLYVAYMSLADQVEALTKERDEYKQAADTIAMQHKVERDKHCNCEFEGDTNTVQCTLHNAWAETLHEQAGFRRERDFLAIANKDLSEAMVRYQQLQDAAKLALDVCIDMRRHGDQRSVAMAIGAEAAIRQAGVQ